MREWTEEEIQTFGLSSLGENWQRAGFRFIPLVTKALCLRCSFGILFLRSEEPGMGSEGQQTFFW
jgi:hypothetical protein